MKAYSPDLCAKIAQACDEGAASRCQLARQFRVSVAFIQKMLRRRRLTGRPAAAAHRDHQKAGGDLSVGGKMRLSIGTLQMGGHPMKMKVQLVVCAEDGREEEVHEIAVVEKPHELCSANISSTARKLSSGKGFAECFLYADY